jgi:branched-chain amino acid aminotransferase
VITPIASVNLEGKERIFNNREPGDVTKKIYELLTGIQRLDIEDEFGWITKV